MILQLTLTFLALIIITWFNGEVIKKLGEVPDCVSKGYYALDNDGWHFTYVMLLEMILLFWPVMSIPAILGVGINTRLLLYLLGGLELLGIGVVGLSPEYLNSKTQYRNHFIASIVSMLASQVWIGFVFPWAYFAWILPLSWKIYTSYHKHTENCKTWEKEMFEGEDWLWWMEIGMFLSTFCAIIGCLV